MPVANGAQLRWSANAATWGGSSFAHYRVYSTRYDIARGRCLRDGWVLEGTTISEQFLVAGLTAGAVRCFAVSAVNRGGVGERLVGGGDRHGAVRGPRRRVLGRDGRATSTPFAEGSSQLSVVSCTDR